MKQFYSEIIQIRLILIIQIMFVDQLSLLEDYLRQNRMTHTLQTLRQELGQKIPSRPSNQLLCLIDAPKLDNEKIAHKHDYSHKKKPEFLADGLLGRIAYSSKILEDQNTNERISHLLENKIFQKAVGKMFPETVPRMKKLHGTDDLDQISGIHSQEDGPSGIDPLHEEGSILSQPSYILEELQKKDPSNDEYTDDNDLGYHQYDFVDSELMTGCSKLTQQYGYPESAVKKIPKLEVLQKKKSKGKKFDPSVKFPESDDKIYPLEYNGVIYDTMKIKLVFDREKTGYEDVKDLDLKAGDVLMGRYEMVSVLGSGVFAKVVKAKDLLSQAEEFTCLKVISNNKDFIDQSFDEMKLLKLIKANCDPDANYLLNFKSATYYKQHLLLQTDLLKDNLFTAYRKNPSFFSIPVIKVMARQILTALTTLHSLNIIHSDLKPENILIKSYSPVEIKVVDLGNSCFVHDNLGTYVQSRSYRAPEVILGNGYDTKIDVWSVGCIIAELWTKNVLFYNIHVAGMIARIQSILGPWPEWMLENGTKVSQYFSKENLIFFEEDSVYHILVPKKTTLKSRIRTDDPNFLAFINYLLEVDPDRRPSAELALKHPFLQ